MLAVVIPCFKEKDHILDVLNRIPDSVDVIYCVDDGCPDQTGLHIRENCRDQRVTVLEHGRNQGVGAAVITGYRQALLDGVDIVVKIDGDGQMRPEKIGHLIAPLQRGRADYAKGNRFYSYSFLWGMPLLRVFGNSVLSFFTKMSSGYWHLFDPTNGFTAIHGKVLRELPLEKISRRYFFESDILFRLNTIRAVVEDVPMSAVYGDERSHMKLWKVIPIFLIGHWRNFGKRIIYNYYIRDFNVGSVALPLGMVLILVSACVGGYHWISSIKTGIEATAGTVMLAALPAILGFQALLMFLYQDIVGLPKDPLNQRLEWDLDRN